MSDVYATIAMAKLVKQAQPRLFDFLLQHRNKHKLNALIDVADMTPLVHVSGMPGAARQHQLGVAAGPAPGQQERSDHVRSGWRYDAAADAERRAAA